MAAYITTVPVRLAAVVLVGAGLLFLVRGHRYRRSPSLAVGAGSMLATLGAATAWIAWFIHPSDGARSWESIPDIYFALFDSWPYTLVVAGAAAGLWITVEWTVSHRWSGTSALAIAVGSVAASVTLGLLDGSISPLG